MKNSYALVTGASSGIGLEISKCLAKKGYNLVLTARSKDRLSQVSKNIQSENNVKVDFISCDLNDKHSPFKIFDYCSSKNYDVSVLVNNAGFANPDKFHETSMEDEEKFIRVLGISVISLTKVFIKKMLQKKHGRIMIISSVAAFAPPSSIQSLYGPIKTFMNRFSEGLNLSYNRKGITSTAVCPGYTVTNFHKASGVQNEMDRVPTFMKKDAKRIAEEAVEATLKGKSLCVPTKTWKIIVFLIRLLPSFVFSLLSRALAPGRYKK
ncbi:MAG: SDR family NAD(P)-dependent oxidoreductase [Flavobacteriaceae bacterium]|nr:SDR family NAD(P)-dependent oxidoreductase [Flavobacteriaceae bacterium]